MCQYQKHFIAFKKTKIYTHITSVNRNLTTCLTVRREFSIQSSSTIFTKLFKFSPCINFNYHWTRSIRRGFHITLKTVTSCHSITSLSLHFSYDIEDHTSNGCEWLVSSDTSLKTIFWHAKVFCVKLTAGGCNLCLMSRRQNFTIMILSSVVSCPACVQFIYHFYLRVYQLWTSKVLEQTFSNFHHQGQFYQEKP